jgi:hypothetical protein
MHTTFSLRAGVGTTTVQAIITRRCIVSVGAGVIVADIVGAWIVVITVPIVQTLDTTVAILVAMRIQSAARISIANAIST